MKFFQLEHGGCVVISGYYVMNKTPYHPYKKIPFQTIFHKEKK